MERFGFNRKDAEARRGGTRLVALLFLVLSTVVWLVFWQRVQRQLVFQNERVALLQAENERLRGLLETRSENSSSELSRRAEIEKATAKIRGLNFSRPVEYDVLSRQRIRETLTGKIAEQYSDQEFENLSAGYAALGLLPRGYPLKQRYIELLGEQVAAFYDQHQHKLYMFEDATLANAQNRVVLAHELTHALQDQHFGLKNLPLEIKDNDDRALAAAALVEGDATLVMAEYMMGDLSWETLRDSLGGLLGQNMEQLQKAPRFLRETLLFPYLRGQEFCAALQARGGYEAISAAYKNPPSSSAQILHPEKYFTEPREEPIPIGWSDTNVLGQKPIADNVLGEFGTRVLLSEHIDSKTAEDAAAGWRGDRYLVFNDGNALIWKTKWASAGEASGFLHALKRALSKRLGISAGKYTAMVDGTGVARGLFEVDAPRFIRAIQTGSNEVVLVDAGTEQWLQALMEKFQDSRDSSLHSE